VDFAPKFFDVVENWEHIGSKSEAGLLALPVAAIQCVHPSDGIFCILEATLSAVQALKPLVGEAGSRIKGDLIFVAP